MIRPQERPKSIHLSGDTESEKERLVDRDQACLYLLTMQKPGDRSSRMRLKLVNVQDLDY